MKNVLVLGIFLAEKENNAENILKNLSESYKYNVIQKWASIGKHDVFTDLKKCTVLEIMGKMPKFKILNQMLRKDDLERFEFILVTDDDIVLPSYFVDNYLEAVEKYNFALAQPARTHDSYIDHSIVEQLDGLVARKTRFVEIGPFFSIRKDLYRYILPFEEKAGMGWGLDYVWPCVVEDAGLSMGIVDAFPVQHKMRMPVANYSRDEAVREMEEYLRTKKHLSRSEACRILESYA